MLRDDLKEAMKATMKAKDAKKLSTIRLILAAIKEKDIEQRTGDAAPDDDAMIINILAKMVKQRGDSIKAYEEAGRCELAENEKLEVQIIQEFLPRQMDDSEMAGAITSAVTETGAEGLRDIGKVMAILKDKYAGRMDFAAASKAVKATLS